MAVTEGPTRTLHRRVGVIGLTFFALGSIIGSGWLFGAMHGVNAAGPASLIAWPLAGVMLLVIVLNFAEIGPMYPVAGGMARFAHYTFGGFGGYTIGWISWIFCIALAPIEVEAALTYLSGLSHLHWLVDKNGALTLPGGYLIAAGLMLIFVVINLYGVRLFAQTNLWTVWWKVAIPVLTIIALLVYFHPANFSAAGGFIPKAVGSGSTAALGVKGIFLALPAGIVFAEIGFDSAIQMAGESRNPRRDIVRAVIYSTIIGVVIYTLLQLAFIGALPKSYLSKGWPGVVFEHTIHGPYAGIAAALGLTWLLYLLYIDAFISPSGTGLIYTGTHARLLYGMSRERYLPPAFASLNLRGVPVFSIVFGWFVGLLIFLPFPTWASLVGPITNVAVITYAVGPIALAHFRRTQKERDRPFRLPAAGILSPLAFIFATLLVYWTGWQTIWRVDAAILVGFVLLAVSFLTLGREQRPRLQMRYSVWLWPYFIGTAVLSLFGAFPGTSDSTPTLLDSWYFWTGSGHTPPKLLQFPYDTIWVALFALGVYYLAVYTSLPKPEVDRYVAADEFEVKADLGAEAPVTAM
jgi:amino acid transporter